MEGRYDQWSRVSSVQRVPLDPAPRSRSHGSRRAFETPIRPLDELHLPVHPNNPLAAALRHFGGQIEGRSDIEATSCQTYPHGSRFPGEKPAAEIRSQIRPIAG